MDRDDRPFFLNHRRLADGRWLVSLHGAVDLFAAPEVKSRLLSALDDGASEIVVDLSATTFMDSTALGALLSAHKRLAARRGRLVLIPGPEEVTRVLEITGLNTIFTLAASREAALAEAGAAA